MQGNGLLDVCSLPFPSRKWTRLEMVLLKESRKEAFMSLSVFLVDYQLLVWAAHQLGGTLPAW